MSHNFISSTTISLLKQRRQRLLGLGADRNAKATTYSDWFMADQFNKIEDERVNMIMINNN
jgi:hypothetical protein